MYTDNGTGLLDDRRRDASGELVVAQKSGMLPLREGTWQFMSVSLQDDLSAPPQLWHDLESAAIWAPLYVALIRTPHNQTDTFDFDFAFNKVISWLPGTVQGSFKYSWFRHDSRDLEFESQPLQRLLQELLGECFANYQGIGPVEVCRARFANLSRAQYFVEKYREALSKQDDGVTPTQADQESQAQQHLDTSPPAAPHATPGGDSDGEFTQTALPRRSRRIAENNLKKTSTIGGSAEATTTRSGATRSSKTSHVQASPASTSTPLSGSRKRTRQTKLATSSAKKRKL